MYRSRIVLSVSLLLALVTNASAGEPDDKRIEELIAKLADIADGDAGYTASMSGSKFAPLDRKAKMHTAILGQPAPVDSETLAEIVTAGAAAIPKLIAHLDDKRETKIKIEHKFGMGGMFFDDEYDYNRRTAKDKPQGVNRDIAEGLNDANAPNKHTVTVGDICFVALGQIVNRNFSAVRYQPTACIMINSPTYSAKLRETIVKEWGKLTVETHRERLIADAKFPDYDSRRDEALRRLAFYYPKDAEAVAIHCLEVPMYCVFKIEEFAREKLYKAKDPKEWAALGEAFIKEHGPAFKEGLIDQLLDDADDEKFNGVPAKALAALFPGIDPKEHRFPEFTRDKDGLIDALAWFDSSAIDKSVLEIFHSLGSGHFADHNDDSLALACMRRLRGKGHDAELIAYCERRIPKADTWKKELKEMLHSLKHPFRP